MNAVEIKIGGLSFNVKSDNPEQLKTMALYVETKLEEVTGGKKEANVRAALLVALNLTEEIFAEKERYEKLQENYNNVMSKIKEKALKVQEHIDVLKNDSEDLNSEN